MDYAEIVAIVHTEYQECVVVRIPKVTARKRSFILIDGSISVV
jgi:hypothetical protein